MQLSALVLAILLVISNAAHVSRRPVMIDDKGIFFKHDLISLIKNHDWITTASTLETCSSLMSSSTANEVLSELIYNAAPSALIFDFLIVFSNPEDLIVDLPAPAKFIVGVLSSHLRWLDRNAKLFQIKIHTPLGVSGETTLIRSRKQEKERLRKIQRLFQVFDATSKDLRALMLDHHAVPIDSDQLDQTNLQAVLTQFVTNTECGSICDSRSDQIDDRDLAAVDCTDRVYCLQCWQRLLENQLDCSRCQKSVQFLLQNVKKLLHSSELQQIVAISDRRSRSFSRLIDIIPPILRKWISLLPVSIRDRLKLSAQFFKISLILIMLHFFVTIYQLSTKSPWSTVCGTEENLYVCLSLGLASIAARLIYGSNNVFHQLLENNPFKF